MFTFAFNFGMNILTPLIHTLAPATPSEGRQHWGCHSWIPAVEVGRSAGVGSIALYEPRHHCKDLSPRSGDHWARVGSEPWWDSCVAELAGLGGVSGSEAG